MGKSKSADGAQKTGKKQKTADQKTRQSMRTAMNKDRRAKQQKRWLTARQKRAVETKGLSKGFSAFVNQGFREEAHLHASRTIVTVDGEITVVKTPSVGRLKLARGIHTKFKEPLSG